MVALLPLPGVRVPACGITRRVSVSSDPIHKEKLQKEIDIEAKREAERLEEVLRSEQNRKKQFRHDWWIAIFTAVTGFVSGAVTDYFFNVVVNAVRLWEFILALLT